MYLTITSLTEKITPTTTMIRNQNVTLAIFLSATESTQVSKNSRKTLHLSLTTDTRLSISKYSRIAIYNGCKLGSTDQKKSGVSRTFDERFTSTRNLNNLPDFFSNCSLFKPRVPCNANRLGNFITEFNIGDNLDSNLDNLEDWAMAYDNVNLIK